MENPVSDRYRFCNGTSCSITYFTNGGKGEGSTDQLIVLVVGFDYCRANTS